MAEKIKTVPDSRKLYEMLKVKYAPPSWALLPQVANGTGIRAYRWADAVAICCWPSLGQEIIGFEIKVHRNDFLGEVRDGEKSQAIFQYCDRWYLVAATKDLVKEGELPPTWGLMYPRGNGLHIEKAAPELQPKALDKSFIASVLRNAMEIITPESKLKAEYERGKQDGLKEGGKNAMFEIGRLNGEIQMLRKAVAEFEKGSGLKFPPTYSWQTKFSDHREFGRAVALVLSGGDADLRKRLEQLRDSAREIADAAEKRLNES